MDIDKTLHKIKLKKGDRVDINMGYFTAPKSGWYAFTSEGIEYLGEIFEKE